jgi:hypothetical protein
MNDKKRELPIKQKIINEEVNYSREQLIRAQLEVKFLRDFIKKMDDPENEEVGTSNYFMPKEEIQSRILAYEGSIEYYLDRMRYYKDLKEKSLQIKEKTKEKHEKIIRDAFQDYAKCPDKLVINGGSVRNV